LGLFCRLSCSFDDFTVTRQALVSDGREYIAARTRFAGLFVRPFTGAGETPIAPNGKRFEYQALNLFRYSESGQLLEEWVQYDPAGLIAQLRER
jgi:predicted ester cyclase